MSPPGGKTLIMLPGSNATIPWTFDDDISKVHIRRWSFRRSRGSGFQTLALVIFDGNPALRKNVLSRFSIEKPSSLVLHNVNQRYNGTYRFTLTVDGAQKDYISDVSLFIASRFNFLLFQLI